MLLLQSHKYQFTTINKLTLCAKIINYRIAGKFGEHYIWRISRWKIFGDFNFSDDLPAGQASRLSSCTYLKYRYRYACAATKGWRVFNLTTLTQIRQTAKINSSPNFPAIRYLTLPYLNTLFVMRTLHHVSSSIMLELVPGLVCVSCLVLFNLPACHLLIHHNMYRRVPTHNSLLSSYNHS